MIAVIIICVILVVIVYQDFSERKATWFLFPFLFVAGIFNGLEKLNLTEYLYYILVNMIFMTIMLLIVFAYSLIRNRNTDNPINRTFGLGDVLFFLAICTLFAPVNLIVFLLSSFIMTLLLHSTYIKIFKANNTIPLAGYISLFLIILYTYQFLTSGWNLYNDSGFIQILANLYS